MLLNPLALPLVLVITRRDALVSGVAACSWFLSFCMLKKVFFVPSTQTVIGPRRVIAFSFLYVFLLFRLEIFHLLEMFFRVS